MSRIVCLPKTLTPAQAETAARRSIEINPANAIGIRTVERTPIGRRGGPRRLALLTRYRWPESGVTLSVQFLDNPSNELRRHILLHMNAWSKTANIQFQETRDLGQVRISRLDSPASMAGYWSYVGTQILEIEPDQPTMNLEGFTMRMPESEFKRVIRHEAGHTLGFEHEHLRAELIKRIDRRKAIEFYDRSQGWTEQETIEQVLTPLSVRSIIGTTEVDPLSIMCYEIPANITKDGKPIRGGNDINAKDYAFAGKLYPNSGAGRIAPVHALAPKPPPSPTPRPAPLTPREHFQETDTFHIVIMDGFDEATGDRPSGSKSRTDASRPKFARVFATYGGARVSAAMRLRADKGEAPTQYGAIISMHERIKKYTNLSEGSLPSDEEMLAFGGSLFETVFQGDVLRLYDEARTHRQNRKLDIVFTSMIPWIAEKPWEFSYDTVRNAFLATEEVHLLRNVLTPVPAHVTLPRDGPLRILVVSAQPVGMGHLSIEQEEDVIRRGFLPLIDTNLVEVEVLARATPRAVLQQLSTGNFTIVHFIGHGLFDTSEGEGAIFFQDKNGAPVALGERSVREIFGKRGINLVFLNACQTGSGSLSDISRGTAQALVSHGLPAAVANQYSVLDTSATSFAQHFYWALAHGMSIGQAACEARIAVNCSMEGELIDWAIPVVYARDPNMTLSFRPDTVKPMTAVVQARGRDTTLHFDGVGSGPMRSVAPVSRRATQDRSVRVAVWDIDNVFPALNETLKTINMAQSVFGFELVALSAPVDAWHVGKDGVRYLWPEKLASRLARMPMDLSVDILACITRQWMRDKNMTDLFAWWPRNKKPSVVVFSCAGFDSLDPAGPNTDRAIANAAVEALAGFLGDAEPHKRNPTNCPLWLNPSRDIQQITSQLRFDPTCRNKLKKKIAKELPALEAILAVFHKGP